MSRHLTGNDSVADLLKHPAFAGFAQLILPGGRSAVDLELPLRSMGTLLPYHTHVETADVLAGLNRMVDDVASGRPVFYDFRQGAATATQRAQGDTGLFFFRGKPGAPFAVIAPGGGFSYVGSVHEGFPYALEINKKGYNAFVLVYRVGQGGQAATEDLAAALSFIFRHAGSLSVAKAGYSLWGSSAGARMAAAIGTHGAAAFGGDDLPAPAAVVMAYTGHSDYAPTDPPTFGVVGEHDAIAPPAVMEQRIRALQRAGVAVDFHRYPSVGHGFGLGRGTSAEGWIADALRFWESAGRQRSDTRPRQAPA